MTKKRSQAGQALTPVLVVVAVAMTLSASAVSITIANTQASSAQSIGQEALSVAQAGVDNALLRLLRDPTYSGETLTVGSYTTLVTVSGTSTKTISSTATVAGFTRSLQVSAAYTGLDLAITNWQEL